MRTRGGSGPTTSIDSIRNAGGAFTNRMMAKNTRRASGHCMCTLHMHMGRYDHPEVVLTLFHINRISKNVVEEIQTMKKRVSNSRCCIQALNSTTCVAASLGHPDLTACSSGTQDRKTISILAAA
jgi:hypothetical protein